jgi:hypothetical protein
MKYFIQNSGQTFSSLERNVLPLIEVLNRLGLEQEYIGYCSEDDTLTGIGTIPEKHFAYGSTKIGELGEKYGLTVSYKPEWFDPLGWVGKRDDFLNEDTKLIMGEDLHNNWISKVSFIKSIEPKKLTGMVLEVEDKEWFEKEYYIDPNEKLVISPCCDRIVQEWRFFILSGEVIVGSQYKHDGVLRIREPIPEYIWKKSRMMAEKWLPNEDIVMDICLLNTGEIKVVEFNSINSSGWYNSNIEKFVLKLEEK